MKKESKMLIGVMAVFFVAVSVIGSGLAVNAYGQESDESNNVPRERTNLVTRNQRIIWFFKGAVKDTITGTIVAQDRNILIVEDGEGDRFNIVLPRRWNIDSQVISLIQMFDEYVSIDDTVTLTVLTRTATNENDVTVTIIFGYEIENIINGNSLYAVLPINIDG